MTSKLKSNKQKSHARAVEETAPGSHRDTPGPKRPGVKNGLYTCSHGVGTHAAVCISVWRRAQTGLETESAGKCVQEDVSWCFLSERAHTGKRENKFLVLFNPGASDSPLSFGGFSHLSFWFLAAKEHQIFVGTLQGAEHRRFPPRLSHGRRPRLPQPPRDTGERTGGRMGGGAECVRHIYSICVMYAGLHFTPGERTVCSRSRSRGGPFIFNANLR